MEALKTFGPELNNVPYINNAINGILYDSILGV